MVLMVMVIWAGPFPMLFCCLLLPPRAGGRLDLFFGLARLRKI